MEAVSHKGALEARRRELEHNIRARFDITIEAASDELEVAQFRSERELATVHRDRECGQLRDVRAALGRIADGSFGSCLDCDEEIGQRRLAAIPWAPRCVICQESADRTGCPALKDAGFYEQLAVSRMPLTHQGIMAPC